jgi:hypothetical protein
VDADGVVHAAGVATADFIRSAISSADLEAISSADLWPISSADLEAIT